jgi:8-oxo-dGTP diphosphatase
MPNVPYTPILATLGYVLSPERDHVLLIHRNAREHDPARGKYNGLGGKLEPGEDVAEGMKRELREEAAIEPTAMTLRGTISWPGFGKNGEDWFGFVFLITGWTGAPPASNPEGALEWVPLTRLLALDLPLWPGDRHFLPLVFDEDPRPFHGVMPYANGQPVSWHVTRL